MTVCHILCPDPSLKSSTMSFSLFFWPSVSFIPSDSKRDVFVSKLNRKLTKTVTAKLHITFHFARWLSVRYVPRRACAICRPQAPAAQIFATLISFGTSAINVALLSAWRGHQHAWFCLLACTLDILINAIAIYWITKPGEWTRNAEGFDTSLLLIRSRKSIDHQQERKEREIQIKACLDPHLPVYDKDAYLKPQPNVYYPMGFEFAAYNDEPPPDTVEGLPPECVPQSPTVPQPILRPINFVEHEKPLARCSTSDESGSSSSGLHKGETRSSDGVERSNNDAREMGFLDFLGEPPGDGREGEDCPRVGVEKEGRLQKAFFRMLLGRGKTSASEVCQFRLCSEH